MMIRKTALELVAVFFAFNENAQALFGFVVLVLILMVQLVVKPFRESSLNHLEVLSLSCTVSFASFDLSC